MISCHRNMHETITLCLFYALRLSFFESEAHLGPFSLTKSNYTDTTMRLFQWTEKFNNIKTQTIAENTTTKKRKQSLIMWKTNGIC